MKLNTDTPSIDDTPYIGIRDLDEYIRHVALTGEEVSGTFAMRDQTLDLAIVMEDGAIQLVVDDTVIPLDSEPSHLVPGAIGRWYFVCPQCGKRFTALYRPTPDAQFACRVCHGLTYSRGTDREATFLKRVAALSGIDPILLQAFRDAMRSRQ